MVANALLLSLAILLAIGFYMMSDLKFLVLIPGTPLPRVWLGAFHLFRYFVSELLRTRFHPHPQVSTQGHRPEALPHREAIPRPPR